MYNGKNKSFKSVLWRAMKQPMCDGLSEEQAADYALELIRRLNISFSYGEEPSYANIKNYRCPIPKDLIYIQGVRYLLDSSPLQVTDEDIPDFISNEDTLRYLIGAEKWQPVKYSGNIYQSTYHCDGKDGSDPNEASNDITYNLNNNYMYFSEREGVVQIAYRKLLMDDEGYPMIPDNQPFEDALYYYILKEHLFGLLAIGKVSQSFYNKLEQEYAWAVGQTTNSLKVAGFDHWESTMNGIRRLILPQNFSDRGYKELHAREKIKNRF